MEALDVRRNIAAEYCGTGNDDIRTGCNDIRRVGQLGAAVDLKLTVVAVLLNRLADRADLVGARVDILTLTAEARLYRHNQYHVQLREQREQYVRRSARLDRNTGLDAGSLDLSDLLQRVAVGFVMYGDDVRTSLDKMVADSDPDLQSSDGHPERHRSPCAAP